MDLQVQDEGARALAEKVGARVLTERALLVIRGDDARIWLNGQVTNDVSHLKVGEATYALVLNLSGKILADVWIVAREEGFLLNVPRECRDSLLEYLDRFVIMEDVEIAADDRAIVAVSGPNTANVAVPAGAVVAPWDSLGVGGVAVLGKADELISAFPMVDEDAWELARLRIGQSRYGLDFGDFTLPQEAGLKTTAVSFDKGCYQGQEAVVMLEHRGKPPKKLVRLEIDGTEPPALETAITDDGDHVVGQVRSAIWDPALERVRAFAYLKRASAVSGVAVRVLARPARVTHVLGG